MKIKAIAVETEFGRRTVQLAVPLDVDPMGKMPPPHFVQSLVEKLWDVLHQVAIQAPGFTAPKAEA